MPELNCAAGCPFERDCSGQLKPSELWSGEDWLNKGDRPVIPEGLKSCAELAIESELGGLPSTVRKGDDMITAIQTPTGRGRSTILRVAQGEVLEKKRPNIT